MNLQPVILCGGSGTRLWPLSRAALPKQFVPLIDGRSLLQLTLERLAPLAGTRGVLCVAAQEHRFLVAEVLGAAGARGRVTLEPVARNTAAAMALAALQAEAEQLMLFCPSDHHIPDAPAFQAMVRAGEAAALRGAIVTFGVVPTHPATGYGYIRRGLQRPDGAHQVARFIEKPSAEVALRLLLDGDCLWNAGIFLCRADTLIEALDRHAPDILGSCREAMADACREGDFVQPAAAAMATCRSQSIDVAVMERHANVAVVPFTGQWSDVGTWAAAAQLTPADDAGNRLVGQATVVNGSGNFVHAPHRRVMVLGVTDLIVVDTPDAVLVAHKDACEQVKDAVAVLQELGAPQAGGHRQVQRPWGSYDLIEQGDRFQVKRIAVKPGAQLSLQKHFHRAEHWIVVKGTAEVTRGDETFLVTENQSTYIPLGAVHRLFNPGRTTLELIEVQSGSYLGEDDIVRLEDRYGRAPQERLAA